MRPSAAQMPLYRDRYSFSTLGNFVQVNLTQVNAMLMDDAIRTSAKQMSIAEKLVPTMIAEQARQNPHKVAVASGSDELTYGELDRRATQLANYLRSLGGPGSARRSLCGALATNCDRRACYHEIRRRLFANGLGRSSTAFALDRERCRRAWPIAY